MSKIIRETWLGTLLFSLGLLIVEILLGWVIPQIQDQLNQTLESLPIAKFFLSALLGVDMEGEITAQLLQAFVWVHPVVLALIWAHEIIFCTRFPVGEIDRGTIDVLLGWPISRRAVYMLETLGWLGSGLILLGGMGMGYLVGSQAMNEAYRPELKLVLLVAVNLMGLYIAVGGVALMVSSLSERRGRAVAVVFALVLASFLINFLAQFWEPAQSFAFLSVLEYYRPALIVKEQSLPVGDLLTLLAVGVIGWGIGLEVTARRNICTT